MQAQQELEYLAMVVQDFIATQPRSAQIALAERAQHCVNAVTEGLKLLEQLKNLEPAAPPSMPLPTDIQKGEADPS